MTTTTSLVGYVAVVTCTLTGELWLDGDGPDALGCGEFAPTSWADQLARRLLLKR